MVRYQMSSACAGIAFPVFLGGAARKGIEQRFGVADSAVFASAVTLTASGAVDSRHDSDTGLGGLVTMFNTLIGRYLPIFPVLALAGSLARHAHTPESSATLPTHRRQFVGLVAAVTVVCALTFVPATALGPLAEGIH